jgi:transposase-like protein
MNDSTTARQHAMNLYRQGLKVNEICRQLNRSRTWFYKWLHRYQSGQQNWYEDLPKTPHKIANKTPADLIKLVLKIRKDLEKTKRSRIGAITIQNRLMLLGWDPPLPVRTINRILKQLHTSRKKQRGPQRKKSHNRIADQPFKQLSLFENTPA